MSNVVLLIVMALCLSVGLMVIIFAVGVDKLIGVSMLFTGFVALHIVLERAKRDY